MTQDGTSLDRLHDIVLPPDVPWWPLAPGWYVLLALSLVLACLAGWRAWRSWRVNAYRRAALRELAGLQDAAAIAELLRRTALAAAPRAEVASRTGEAWLGWLAAKGTGPLPETVREQLTEGVYGRPDGPREVGALREYAADWIAGHQPLGASPALEREAPRFDRP